MESEEGLEHTLDCWQKERWDGDTVSRTLGERLHQSIVI